MTDNVHLLISASLEGRRLLEHPFYRRWEAGELLDGELRGYAEQYRFFETELPRFLDTLAQRMSDGPARDAVLDNLRDETSSPSHLELFELFAEYYGARDETISPAMSNLVRAYQHVLSQSDASALAGLLAYETQGAEVARSKADGLRRHYDARDDATVFWDTHGTLEEDHASWTLDALATMSASESEIRSAAQEVADAWWEFLSEREALVAA